MPETQDARAESLKDVLRTVEIPSCPAVLVQLRRLLQLDNTNLNEIARVVAQDVGLSASLLKVVNSPLFGLAQKVDSVAQAVTLLGLSSVNSISAAVMLKNVAGGKDPPELASFWDAAGRVGMLCARVAREVGGVASDVAYTYGLFHNAGTAVLMKRFPDYVQTLKLAQTQPESAITTVEDARHRTNHTVIGYLLTRSWGLSEQISSAVLVHHDFSIFGGGAEPRAANARRLVAIGALATYLVHDYLQQPLEHDWTRERQTILDHLDMTVTELLDLREACFEELDL